MQSVNTLFPWLFKQHFTTVYRSYIHPAHLLTLLVCASLLTLPLAGCSFFKAPLKHAIKADYDVPVVDADLRKLTDVTASMDMTASGQFKPGTYLINGVPVSFPADTTFQLELSLPIDDPKVISTREARGTLTTSRQWSVNGLPAPSRVFLDRGTVSGEVDLVRTLGAFFFDLIQPGTVDGDVRDLIQTIRIEEAKLHLREGSRMKLDQKEFHFGPDSTITLSSISVDQNFNYQGVFDANLTFLPGSKWVGERVDCYFSGGQTHLRLRMTKNNNALVLKLAHDSGPKNIISLEDCTFHFGKSKRSSSRSDLCLIDVKEMGWKHVLGEKNSDLHLLGKMDFQKTQLVLRTDIHQTAAFFPASVPATMELNIDDQCRSTHFTTEGFARAEAGRIDINKKATKLSLWLADAVVGPIEFDKLGSLQFKLVNGIARLKQLDWQGATSKFTLATAGSSTISLPDGMLLEQSKSELQPRTHMELPLTIKLGAATLRGMTSEVKLTDLRGTIKVVVGNEVQLASDMDFAIPGASFLGGQRVDVQARGLNLEVANGKSLLQLNRCALTVPTDAFEDVIKKKVPSSFHVQVNKLFTDKEEWRYRNPTAREVRVDHLDVQAMNVRPDNQIAFNATADVAVNGTVEKSKFLGKGVAPNWSELPWTLTGRVESDGLVQYKFIPKDNCADSQIEYKLSMDIPIPHDVTLDWSHVTNGLMKVIERGVIVRKVREMKVPLNLTGRLNLFSENDKLWSHFGIKDLSVISADQDCKIQFSATAHL